MLSPIIIESHTDTRLAVLAPGILQIRADIDPVYPSSCRFYIGKHMPVDILQIRFAHQPFAYALLVRDEENTLVSPRPVG